MVPMPRTRNVWRASAAQPSFSAMTPAGSSDASITTAAAPSPKSTATLRLLQPMYGLMTSTPITSALRTTPVRTIAVAVESPYRKLVQAVFKSMAAAWWAPSMNCTPEAVLGTCSSAEQVPRMIRSSSLGSSLAHASARAAAMCDNTVMGTCEMRRSLMPVRVVIHSSLVSKNVARSALLRTAGGMHLPQPVIAAYFMTVETLLDPVRDHSTI